MNKWEKWGIWAHITTHVGGLFTNSSQTNSPRSTSKIAEKNKHVIHRPGGPYREKLCPRS